MLRGHHLIDAAQEMIVSASPQLMSAVFGSNTNEPGDNGVKQPVVLPLSGHGLQSSSRRSSLARIGLVQPTCHGLIGSSRRGGFCDIGRATHGVMTHECPKICQRRAKSPREERAAAVKMAKRGRGLREDETEETTQTSETLSAAATQTASQPPILLQGETDALRSGCPLQHSM